MGCNYLELGFKEVSLCTSFVPRVLQAKRVIGSRGMPMTSSVTTKQRGGGHVSSILSGGPIQD